MTLATKMAGIARSPRDPKILRTGPGSRTAPDHLAQALGWFSIGLGVLELAAPGYLTRKLGMNGQERLVQAYGVREIAAGMTSLSTEKQTGIWSRVGGDFLDLATLLAAYRQDNPRRRNVGMALAAVSAITVLDLASAGSLRATHARDRRKLKDYSNRSGWPKGLATARAARYRKIG
jgi:hypothetical protein